MVVSNTAVGAGKRRQGDNGEDDGSIPSDDSGISVVDVKVPCRCWCEEQYR